MKKLLAIIAATAFAMPAMAQVVNDCYRADGDTFLSQIRTLAEPWEDNTRTFANGAVRIAILDTWDPANYPMHLMVLFWPAGGSEAEGRTCLIVSDVTGAGFQSLTLTDMQTGYDPAIGLLFELAAQRYDPDSGAVSDGALSLTLNRATNQLAANYQ